MKYKCPHCKKVLDLSEVITKQAQNLADQEVDKKLKIKEKAAREEGAKDAYLDRDVGPHVGPRSINLKIYQYFQCDK